ncbi:MAG: M42 family metallopeptidase [Tissierellales bacterium]|nr:M42 family metallopeptidase [Tissierellales bacterium]MBN2827728.1 M42 family metallopeptidase [Tissierellales bacterium]
MDKDSLAKSLIILDNIMGVSGYEERVGEEIKAQLEGYCDEIKVDNLGNHIFIKRGKSSNFKIMICAHMDELGFIVKYIEDDGKIRFAPIGYHDKRILLSQEVIIQANKVIIQGVINTKPLHLSSASDMEKNAEIKDMFIDIGTETRKETEDLGVRIGDLISFDKKGTFLNNTDTYCGKSVDDRAGCAVLVEVMKRLKEHDTEATIYGVGSVMEEIGMRGARTATYNIEPNLAIVLDVTPANGIPGVENKDVSIFMGKGPAIKFYEWDPGNSMAGVAVPKKITDALISVAEKYNIPYQREVLINAATDAWGIALSRTGVPTGVVSIPSRYIHTTTETVNIKDLENTVELVLHYILEAR